MHCIVLATVLVKKWTNIQTTEPEPAATQPRPAPLSQVYLFFLIHIIKGWCQWICYFTDDQEVEVHYIVFDTAQVKIRTNNQITEPEAEATQPRPSPLSQVCMVFLYTYFPRMV
jgi:hypothetical protein